MHKNVSVKTLSAFNFYNMHIYMLNTSRSCAFKVVAGFWVVPVPLDKMAITLLINIVGTSILSFPYVRTYFYTY